MQNNRRNFIKASTFSLTALANPAWIKTALEAPQDDAQQPRLKRLEAAWKRAKAGGRPLLVFIIPKDEAQGRVSGRAWGQFLNHGAPEHLALLTLAELTCASHADLKSVLGGELKRAEQELPPEEHGALLFETGHASMRIVIPARRSLVYSWFGGDKQDSPELCAERIETRITRTGGSLRRLLWPDQATRDRRVREEALAIDLDTEQLADEELARVAPAALLARVGEHPKRLELAFQRLASRTAMQMKQPIDGTRWATSRGCGITIEGRAGLSMGILCGSGMVGHLSGRFLLLYTAS